MKGGVFIPETCNFNKGLSKILEYYTTGRNEGRNSEPYVKLIHYKSNFENYLKSIVSENYEIRDSRFRNPMVVFDIKFIDESFESSKDLQVAYLFKPDGSGVYLSYMLIVSNFKEENQNFNDEKYELIKNSRDEFRKFVLDIFKNSNFNFDDLCIELDLNNQNQFAKAYEHGTLFSKYYELNDSKEFDINENEFKNDLFKFLKLFECLDLYYHDFKNHNDYNDPNRKPNGKNELFYGVPGSGKSHAVKKEYGKDESYIERILFHPDYEYSDFIGQILPKTDEGEVSYPFFPGPFTRILKKAFHNPEKEYYLVIEEINRGNAPAIFGDIFQLLDRFEEDGDYIKGTSEYSITNSNIAKEIYTDVEYIFFGDKIRIPSNLSIIATMNTSDQNVFTLDTAFQRRWNMRLIENRFDNNHKFKNDKILDSDLTWEDFCNTINKEILKNINQNFSSEDKRIGVYFVKKSDLKYDDTVENESADKDLISKAKRNNSKFAEKVLKYLWDDAFKFYHEKIFNLQRCSSLDEVIREFNGQKKNNRFVVFKEGTFSNLDNINYDVPLYTYDFES